MLLTLNRKSLLETRRWQEAGIETIRFDHDRMLAVTRRNPAWVHFGAGNIFRGFIAVLQQTLLNEGLAAAGIVAAETFDYEIIEKIYKPCEDLSLLVIMNPDGSLGKKIVASVAESLIGDPVRQDDWKRLQTIFTQPSLQLASFTITEKGYNLNTIAGELLPEVQADLAAGPDRPQSVMAKIAALAYTRYRHGQLPIALVSMDNCSHNGERLQRALAAIAAGWARRGLVDQAFLAYLDDPRKVSFPWSMIDKITPRPSEKVKATLNRTGFAATGTIRTGKNTFIAPFVNAEKPEYLVIEDAFPNGRPLLEAAGVIFTDRETVGRVEKMKVCTCLNPLHTALAIFGCLLGYTLIADEMKDRHLKKLVEKIGCEEGMPVVVHPGIIDPAAFLREVLEIRLPNPYIPDSPQRIATDTSQKVGIRFGETVKAYRAQPGLEPGALKYIPLVIAGWCRYLLGLDDKGGEMALSSDPLLPVLQTSLAGIRLGDPGSVGGKLRPILANKEIFGLDLYEAGLGEKIENYFKEMIAGPGAVRATLQRRL